MTKFILHGGFTRVQNALNRGFYAEMSRGVPDGGTILLVYFAGKDEDIGGNSEYDKEQILEQASGKSLNFVVAAKDNFMDQVKAADLIYLRGGDTDKLLTILQEYPDFKDAIQGKIISGSSAGAYVLSTYYFSNLTNTAQEGLGILPIRIACHYQSTGPGFDTTDDPAERMKDRPADLELIILKDYEWKVVEV